MFVNGIKYNLIDDCDTLICKLENKIDDFYYDNVKCDIDKLEADLQKLQHAIDNNDRNIMQIVFNEYHTMFKRYQ